MKLLTFDQYFDKSLKNPDFKKLWEMAGPEYQLSRQIIKKRLENSTFNPSLNLLKRISLGLDSKLTIQI